MLYLITLRPLFFRASDPDQRMRTVLHELFHISSRFDGTLHQGRRHARLGKGSPPACGPSSGVTCGVPGGDPRSLRARRRGARCSSGWSGRGPPRARQVAARLHRGAALLRRRADGEPARAPREVGEAAHQAALSRSPGNPSGRLQCPRPTNGRARLIWGVSRGPEFLEWPRRPCARGRRQASPGSLASSRDGTRGRCRASMSPPPARAASQVRSRASREPRRKPPTRPGRSRSRRMAEVSSSSGSAPRRGARGARELMKYVPVDSMAFIVVQHLAPHHESILTQLLARNSRLAVVTAEDGMPVEANHVYVIPPNADLAMLQGVIRVITPPHACTARACRSTTSSARSPRTKGRRAIGIVLSGTGTDGTFGLKAIKAAGGSPSSRSPRPRSTTACRAARSRAARRTSASRPRRSARSCARIAQRPRRCGRAGPPCSPRRCRTSSASSSSSSARSSATT